MVLLRHHLPLGPTFPIHVIPLTYKLNRTISNSISQICLITPPGTILRVVVVSLDSQTHTIWSGDRHPLGMANAGSVGQSPGSYVPPVQTHIYQTGSWAPMVDYNASQQTAILFNGLATVPVSTVVSTVHSTHYGQFTVSLIISSAKVQGRAVPSPTDLEVPSGASISGGSVCTFT